MKFVTILLKVALGSDVLLDMYELLIYGTLHHKCDMKFSLR